MAFRNFLDGAALSYLKNTDPDTEEIVQIELEVSIYKTSSTSNKLEEIKFGNFFLYSRSSAPKYGFVILNRLDYESDLIEKITGNLEVEDDGTPLLTFRSAKNGVYKMWFSPDEERKKFVSEINELIKTERLSEARRHTVLEVKESNQIAIGSSSSDFASQMKQPISAGNFQQSLNHGFVST